MSPNRAFLPCCSERFRFGLSTLAWNTNTHTHRDIQSDRGKTTNQTIIGVTECVGETVKTDKSGSRRPNRIWHDLSTRCLCWAGSRGQSSRSQTDKQTDRQNDLQQQRWEEGEALGVVGEAGLASSLASLHFTLSALDAAPWRTDNTHTHALEKKPHWHCKMF